MIYRESYFKQESRQPVEDEEVIRETPLEDRAAYGAMGFILSLIFIMLFTIYVACTTKFGAK